DLARLRDARAGDGDDALHHRGVEGDGEVAADAVDAADHLGDVAGGKIAVAGVLALRTEGEEEVLAGLQTGLLQDRAEQLLRRAGVGGALQHDELAAAQVRADRAGRRLDARQVRLAVLRQRRRHANDDRVNLAEAGGVGRGVEAAGADQLGDAVRTDV